MAAPVVAGSSSGLLASDHVGRRVDLRAIVRTDRCICAPSADGGVRRAEPGPAGALVLGATVVTTGTDLRVWGPAGTPAEAAEAALLAARAWAGLDDDPAPLAEAVGPSRLLRRLLGEVGEVRLSRMPRVGEALGRSVLEQLVQGVEAGRAISAVARRYGHLAEGLHTWPTALQLGVVPAHELRRCGVSLRNAGSLHAAAVESGRLDRAAAEAVYSGDFARLDARLRALPGVGNWTSAETRLRLGDADAVSTGDYNLPAFVGAALGGPEGDGPDGAWTDAGMLALLAPFAGQRGRVIVLLERAARRGLVRRPARRAPRARVSVHRRY